VKCERLEKELRDANEHASRLNQQIQNVNKECSALKYRSVFICSHKLIHSNYTLVERYFISLFFVDLIHLTP